MNARRTRRRHRAAAPNERGRDRPEVHGKDRPEVHGKDRPEVHGKDRPPEQASSSSPPVSVRIVLLAALIGLPAALLAAAFLALVHAVEHGLWTDLPAALGAPVPPWYLVLGLPVAGAALVLAARKLLPGDGGHAPLEGMSTAPAPLSYAPGVALAALGTLGFGAVLGPEGPLIALGCAVGTAVAAIARVDPRESRLLTAAGAFSAISAVFGGPLVASFMLIEGGAGLGPALIPTLLPGLVAAAVGYLIFVGIGDWGGVAASTLAVPGLPPYVGTSATHLAVAVAVGVVAAVVVAPARQLGTIVAAQSKRTGMAAPLLLGALAVGVLALIVRALGGDSQDLLFSGQASLPSLAAQGSVAVLVILLVAKGIAYGICLGCGFRGGPVFPPIFLGIALAMIPAVLLHQPPTLAVAVGAAAGMAAATRLPFSAVLFAALLVGSSGQDAVPAAVLASAAAWLTVTALQRKTARAEATGEAGRDT